MSAPELKAHIKEPPLGGESEPGLAPCEEDEGTDKGRGRRASHNLIQSADPQSAEAKNFIKLLKTLIL